jgi:hypothetical protein
MSHNAIIRPLKKMNNLFFIERFVLLLNTREVDLIWLRCENKKCFRCYCVEDNKSWAHFPGENSWKIHDCFLFLWCAKSFIFFKGLTLNFAPCPTNFLTSKTKKRHIVCSFETWVMLVAWPWTFHEFENLLEEFTVRDLTFCLAAAFCRNCVKLIYLKISFFVVHFSWKLKRRKMWIWKFCLKTFRNPTKNINNSDEKFIPVRKCPRFLFRPFSLVAFKIPQNQSRKQIKTNDNKINKHGHVQITFRTFCFLLNSPATNDWEMSNKFAIKSIFPGFLKLSLEVSSFQKETMTLSLRTPSWG